VTADEIRLTLPADDAFYSVAHLVLGGLAARLNLTFENLEDLELALDSLLERPSDGREVTLRVLVEEGELRMVVGPFTSVRAEFEEGGVDSLNLGRILGTVCDSVEIEDRDGAQWVELTKRLDGLKGVGA
jgi:anti-sigma regulatory factor (Ser/Thr protein kinase)